jgi:hypothetical protein
MFFEELSSELFVVTDGLDDTLVLFKELEEGSDIGLELLQSRDDSVSSLVHLLWNFVGPVKFLEDFLGKVNHVCLGEKLQLGLQDLILGIDLRKIGGRWK